MLEYEKTLQDFLAQKSSTETVSKDSVEKIMRERDQAIEDTDTIERAFNDLHRRYDKSKQVIEAIKAVSYSIKLKRIVMNDDQYFVCEILEIDAAAGWPFCQLRASVVRQHLDLTTPSEVVYGTAID